MFDFFSLHGIKLDQKVLIFAEKYIIKMKFHMREKSININEVDIKKVVFYNKELKGNKGWYEYFIGYNGYNVGITLLYIKNSSNECIW